MRILWTLLMWLTCMSLPFVTLASVDAVYGPSTHVATGHCTRACHDRGCAHLPSKVDLDRPAVRAARAVYLANIRALRQPAFGYRDTNLLVYVVGFPSMLGLLLWSALWRQPGRGAWVALTVAFGGLLVAAGPVLARPGALGGWGAGRDALYWACTDFCVHMGNLSGLTYEGFNFALFVVAFPATTLSLLGFVGYRWASGLG